MDTIYVHFSPVFFMIQLGCKGDLLALTNLLLQLGPYCAISGTEPSSLTIYKVRTLNQSATVGHRGGHF